MDLKLKYKNCTYWTMIIFVVGFSSCDSDLFPKKYIFNTVENSGHELYVVNSSNELILQSDLIGSYPMVLDTLPELIETFSKEFNFIEEFELLSLDQLRVKFKVGDNILDTVFMYTVTGTDIIVENEELNDIIKYNAFTEEFTICFDFLFTKKGPIGSASPQAYSADVSYCENDRIEDLLLSLTQSFDYVEGDSIGIFLAEMIYTKVN